MSSVEMVRIGDYCTVVKGKIGIKKAVEGNYPLVTTAEERLSHNEYHFDKPSVIIPVVSSTGHGHASLKRIHYQEGQFSVGSILAVITPNDQDVVSANFLYHYLDTYKEKLLVSQMKGMANVTLPVKAIENVEFPLITPEEQLKWVKLFLKTKQYTGNLSNEIIHQQTLMKKLRQQILQDAISGKLTTKWREDNSNIEPASELLVRIKTEKERLIREKKIKKLKPLPTISDDEIPFELPNGWCWCHLGDIVEKIHYGFTASANDNLIDTRLLRITDIQDGEVNWETVPGCEHTANDVKNYLLNDGDILIARTGGTIGKSYLVNNITVTSLFASYLIRVVPFKHLTRPEYLKRFIESNLYWNQLYEYAWGAGQLNVNATSLSKLILPFPPHDEMFEIESRVLTIFEIIDKLQIQATKSQQEADFLIQTVLKEAFEG